MKPNRFSLIYCLYDGLAANQPFGKLKRLEATGSFDLGNIENKPLLWNNREESPALLENSR